MMLLDTDHINVLTNPESRQRADLLAKMQTAGEHVFATSPISVEEQVRGWLALINATSDVAKKQVPYYERFVQLFVFFRRWVNRAF
jgi:hypothetical protein